MVKTRWTGQPAHSEAVEEGQRVRPTASRRRHGKGLMVDGPSNNEEEEHVDDDQDMGHGHEVEIQMTETHEDEYDDDADGGGSTDNEEGQENVRENDEIRKRLKQIYADNKKKRSFPGGPDNLSVIRSYGSHVAERVWRSYLDDSVPDRGILTVYNNYNKVGSSVGLECEYIANVLRRSGLASLADIRYKQIDRGLISAFIERWHPETNSFHFPFGEMTITLDDVSCLLHIPVHGRFFTLPDFDLDQCVDVLVSHIGVTRTQALSELENNRGPKV
ncbi:uncharacterized protein LOC130747744 [Lotus japonicus]|uniref:uncharacterized protein LOC130747744 n=1 Tax=Lotus japonicus TaxID=34305 RepID=UPI002590B3BB|nr:uncharacterized protein LOC130747744 [Lotus japonicus]